MCSDCEAYGLKKRGLRRSGCIFLNRLLEVSMSTEDAVHVD